MSFLLETPNDSGLYYTESHETKPILRDALKKISLNEKDQTKNCYRFLLEAIHENFL